MSSGRILAPTSFLPLLCSNTGSFVEDILEEYEEMRKIIMLGSKTLLLNLRAGQSSEKGHRL
jgi:hypothetical protein